MAKLSFDLESYVPLMNFDFDEEIEAMENRVSGGCWSVLITVVVCIILFLVLMLAGR